MQNSNSLVLELINAKANPNQTGINNITPLLMAVALDMPDLRVVTALLENKADVNLPELEGATPLLFAMVK